MPYDLKNAKGSSAIPMTPFTDSDYIDEEVLAAEIEFIVKCGSTSITTPVMVSEFEALSESERKLMIKIPCEAAAGRLAIIANVAAPCANQAVDYAAFAQEYGADAVIAMPPAGVDFEFIRKYYKKISDAVSLPIMIQNHSMAGTMLSPNQVIELCEEIENVRWVKQECIPGPVSISSLMSVKTPALEGVMSGFGSQYAPLDFARGATATIHACEWADLVQQVWDLFFEGKEKEGRERHCAVLPALQLEGILGMKYAKEVMMRRGVFKNSNMRRASRDLSADDAREIDVIFESVSNCIRV
ncbi:MAG: dihydrodipicolinate synthase family protein [Clostridiales bacterium]|jgi:4-hydroxy-tetrahydrodipicolinate synthase|nr:dihydrodipicolinate synthase family protein [Clostridiales bacterium]